LLPRLASVGDSIESVLTTLQQRYSGVLRGTRRAGMMFGLDFADDAMGMAFLGTMFALGVLVVASSQRLDVLKLYPPLILEESEIAIFAERMESALKQLS
jgi:diaminobutyrate-2-oxoglutarate transaminase